MSNEMNFCPDCNNLMFAKEDTRSRRLKFVCQLCDCFKYVEPSSAEENCVERLNYNYKPEEDILVASNLSKDPTLGRTHNWYCDNCHGTEALFFQLPERKGDEKMSLVFACCNEACGRWKKQDSETVENFNKFEGLNSTNILLESSSDKTNYVVAPDVKIKS